MGRALSYFQEAGGYFVETTLKDVSEPKMKKYRLFLIAIGLILSIAVFYPYQSQELPFRDGKQIADILIEAARKNEGVAPLSIVAEKVCVDPGAVGGPGLWKIERYFPGMTLAYKEQDNSEGYWYVFFARNNAVFVYGISESDLRWLNHASPEYIEDPPFEIPPCPTEVLIDYATKLPRVKFFR